MLEQCWNRVGPGVAYFKCRLRAAMPDYCDDGAQVDPICLTSNVYGHNLFYRKILGVNLYVTDELQSILIHLS